MPICPKCGSEEYIPIVYGRPNAELQEKAERGEVILGGCVVSPDSNLFRCKDCGTDYK